MLLNVVNYTTVLKPMPLYPGVLLTAATTTAAAGAAAAAAVQFKKTLLSVTIITNQTEICLRSQQLCHIK